MINIIEASINDFKIIQDIAFQTWPIAYGEILSQAQLDYMLDAFYNEDSLKESVAIKGHHFILAQEGAVTLGFASFEHFCDNKEQTKIHKIYILPQAQGKGVGKILIEYVENQVRKQHSGNLFLNVNRFNTAITFYKKMGFAIVKEVDIELDHGYLMEDYIMEKSLK
jgi:GNAT superfamily N-acetyltransferase